MSYPENPSISFPQPTTYQDSYSTIQRRPSSSPSPSPQREVSPTSLRRRSTGHSPMESIENTVTQLLFTTKSLLEALTSWSTGTMNGQQVSDVYVKLGGELNTVIRLFNRAGVDTSDMAGITQDLRGCLEKALGEEASPATLERHLPSIKDIIVGLLQGLKAKQKAFRQICDSNSPNLLERRASRRQSVFKRDNLVRCGSNLGLMPPMIVESSNEEGGMIHEGGMSVKGESATPQREMSPPPEYAPPSDDSGAVSSNATTKNDQCKTLTLYLQLGKDVKKVKYDGDMSIPALRMLFIEKFQYNPGMDDFPNIYIREPQLGVFYELEDLKEVRNNSVLSLNIEALEQVKKHIDHSIAELTKELRDVKKSVVETELKLRGSIASTNPAPNATQLVNIVRGVVSSIKEQNNEAGKKTNEHKIEFVAKIANDLRSQFDEVQNLRRDLGVVRQIYTEFQGETKQLFESLTAQTATVKNLSLTNVGSTRVFIDEGKAKLDNRTSNLLTKVNELQDIIDELKIDVTQRRAKPKETTVQQIKKDSTAVTQELESLQQHVKTVKPTWKKTWEDELQVIVEEQKFLNHQEELIEDLQEDNKKLTEVLDNILKVVEFQANSKKEFTVKPMEEGFEGLKTVLQELKVNTPDHGERLRAIEQLEKTRERELSNRIDEFEAELTEFVSQNKLKKTGGAQEVERLRQKKNDDALKELFKANQPNPEGETS